MLAKIAQMIKDATENLEEVGFRNTYSGRGMYGSECIGITGAHSDCMQILAEAIKNARSRSVDDDGWEFEQVVDILVDFRMDSMGLGVILYWPQLGSLPEEMSIENE